MSKKITEALKQAQYSAQEQGISYSGTRVTTPNGSGSSKGRSSSTYQRERNVRWDLRVSSWSCRGQTGHLTAKKSGQMAQLQRTECHQMPFTYRLALADCPLNAFHPNIFPRVMLLLHSKLAPCINQTIRFQQIILSKLDLHSWAQGNCRVLEQANGTSFITWLQLLYYRSIFLWFKILRITMIYTTSLKHHY